MPANLENAGVTTGLNRSVFIPIPNAKECSNYDTIAFILFQLSSVQSLSRVQLFVTPWIAGHQASLSLTNSWSLSNPCPLSWWCHPAISSSVVPFSFCPQSFWASGSFPMSQLCIWCQSIGVSPSTSILPKNTQNWSPLGWSGWISLQSKGLSKSYTSQHITAYTSQQSDVSAF